MDLDAECSLPQIVWRVWQKWGHVGTTLYTTQTLGHSNSNSPIATPLYHEVLMVRQFERCDNTNNADQRHAQERPLDCEDTVTIQCKRNLGGQIEREPVSIGMLVHNDMQVPTEELRELLLLIEGTHTPAASKLPC